MGCISHFLGICNAPERFSIHHPSKSLMFGMFHMIFPSRKVSHTIQQNENNSCKFLPDQISQQNPTPPKSTHNHTHLPSSVLQSSSLRGTYREACPTDERLRDACSALACKGRRAGLSPQKMGGLYITPWKMNGWFT